MIAAQHGHLNVVKFLVDKGVPWIKLVLKAQPSLASLNGHLEITNTLLSAGANINHLDANGVSPLYAAAQEGRLKIAKLLVKKGADIHQATIQGVTPLQTAALAGQNEVVQDPALPHK